MPPRSATRKKSTWKSKQSELELSLADQSNTMPESENKGQEALSAAVKDEGGEQVAPLVIAGVEIKQELGVLDSNYADRAVMSTAVKTKVKEEEDGERMEGDHDKFDNAADEKEVKGEQKEGIHVEQNLSEEGTAAAQIDDAEAFVDNDSFPVLNQGSDGQEGGEVGGKDEEDIGDSEEDNVVDNEHEEHPAEFINNHINDRKKKKDFEIFIGRPDKGAIEDDLIEVFRKFGEIKAARIVRNPTTNKSRGFAFIQYVTVEQAKNALSALNEGIQVRGKHVIISASQDNDSLYGQHLQIMDKRAYNPQKEGKIKGFALLEFSTHSDAMAAFQRLRKPDAVFGCDRSAKVAFAQTPMHPNQEILCQVKANIAKPHFEGRLQKQGTRGGFKVKKKSEVPSMKEETERKNIAAPSKMKGNAKFKQAKKKGKMVTEEKGNAILRQKLVEAKCGKGKTIISRRQRDPHIRKGPNYGADFIEYRNPYAPGYSAPAVRCQSHAYNTVSGSKRSHADMYQPHVGHLESVVGTQSEPHTGYHVPAVGNHSISRAGYLEPILGTRGQPHAGYLEPAIGRQGQSHAAYFKCSVGKHSHNSYDIALRRFFLYTFSCSALSCNFVTLINILVTCLVDRAGGHDLRGSGYSAYGAVSSLLAVIFVGSVNDVVRFELPEILTFA
ncbi:hypothetical protein TEA_004078 [Camellia sinensis var. sinensis]|uniref:RRM domain-containing protein n=1 Tax=Camellia sinensis var. sinensis TaxID=542762 RepID=A0A4S4EUF9_CAMSN|nr:hypothetical protein TEA_004078 [Camellia sinensis var. sinensis]